jgi:hypothetical protein
MTKAAARVTLAAAFSFYRCSSSHVIISLRIDESSISCAGLCGGLGSMSAARFYLPSPIVASRHREARSDPFMIDLRKIYFQKKSISFPVTYPTANDNKRLLSTTNVCSTA